MNKHLSYCSFLFVGLSFCANAMEQPKRGAGVFLVSKNGSGRWVTLIGQRDDCEYWCNLGGQSEDGESSFVTASREVCEESFGLFSIPPSVLKNSRCITNDCVENSQYGTREHVMYFQYVNYIDEKILNKIIKRKHEQAEYRQFAWEPLDEILAGSHQLMPEFKKSIELGCNIIKGIFDGSEKLEWQLDIEDGKQNVINEQKRKIQNGAGDSSSARGVISPSLKFLQIILGEENISEKVIENDDRLWSCICGFWSSWASRRVRETKDEITLDDEAKKAIIAAIRFEQEEHLKDNRVVYHGLDGKLLFLYKYWGKFFSVVYGKRHDYVLRGDSSLFMENGQVLSAAQAAAGRQTESNYGNSVEKLFLFVNPMLFLGQRISQTTSSSLEYFLAQHSAQKHSLKNLLSTFFSLFGMNANDSSYACRELKSLYRQFLKYNNADKLDKPCNGGLLAISIPQRDIAGLSMSSYHDGCRFKAIDPNMFYGNVMEYPCSNYRGAGYGDIQYLTNEFRIHLDPSYNFRIKAFLHYEPTDADLFNRRLEALVEKHLSNMLGCMQVDSVLYCKDNIFELYNGKYPDIPLTNHLIETSNVVKMFESVPSDVISDLLQRKIIKLPDFDQMKGALARAVAKGEAKVCKLIFDYYWGDFCETNLEAISMFARSQAMRDEMGCENVWNEFGDRFLKSMSDDTRALFFRFWLTDYRVERLENMEKEYLNPILILTKTIEEDEYHYHSFSRLLDRLEINNYPNTEKGRKTTTIFLSYPIEKSIDYIAHMIRECKLYSTEHIYKLCYDLDTLSPKKMEIEKNASGGDLLRVTTKDKVEISIDVSKFKLPMFCSKALFGHIGATLLNRSSDFISGVAPHLPRRFFLGELNGHIWVDWLKKICEDESITWKKIENHINDLDEIGLLLTNMDKLDDAVFANKKNDNFLDGVDENQASQLKEATTKEEAKKFVDKAILKYLQQKWQILSLSGFKYSTDIPVWSVVNKANKVEFANNIESYMERLLNNYDGTHSCSDRYIPSVYGHKINPSFINNNSKKLPSREVGAWIEDLYSADVNKLSFEALSSLHGDPSLIERLLWRWNGSDNGIKKYIVDWLGRSYRGFSFTNKDAVELSLHNFKYGKDTDDRFKEYFGLSFFY